MWKQALAFGGGILVGVAVIGVGFYCYKQCKKKEKISEEEISNKKFADKIKKIEESGKKFEELLSTQSYVELLTAKELTSWFKENRASIIGEAKMIIAYPTENTLKGLGYYSNEKIDTETNIIQLFYNEDTSEVLKIRLVSYSEIESNLQALLIEQEGMIVVTD